MTENRRAGTQITSKGSTISPGVAKEKQRNFGLMNFRDGVNKIQGPLP